MSEGVSECGHDTAFRRVTTFESSSRAAGSRHTLARIFLKASHGASDSNSLPSRLSCLKDGGSWNGLGLRVWSSVCVCV